MNYQTFLWHEKTKQIIDECVETIHNWPASAFRRELLRQLGFMKMKHNEAGKSADKALYNEQTAEAFYSYARGNRRVGDAAYGYFTPSSSFFLAKTASRSITRSLFTLRKIFSALRSTILNAVYIVTGINPETLTPIIFILSIKMRISFLNQLGKKFITKKLVS